MEGKWGKGVDGGEGRVGDGRVTGWGAKVW